MAIPCLDRYSSDQVELILLVDLLLSLISNGFTILNINWKIFPERYNALCVITFLFLITAFGTCLALICYRKNKTVNEENNQFAVYLSWLNIVLTIVGLAILITSLIKILDYYTLLEKKLSVRSPEYINLFKKNGQWYFFTVSEIITIVLVFFSLIIWSSVLQRLRCKISGARTGNESFGSVEIRSSEN